MRENLKGRTVLVTGASSGIGRAIAEAFADEGARIALCALPDDKDLLEQVAAGMAGRAEAVITIPADLTRDEDLQGVVPAVGGGLGDVDILVNNAGLFLRAEAAEASVEEFDRCVRLNLRAPFVLSKAVIPEMLARKWGRIINIGSSSAHQGFAGTSIYCASKHGLLGLSRSLHEELRTSGVRVHLVSPSDTDTPQYRRFFTIDDASKVIEPREIAEMVLFLAQCSGRGVVHEVRFGRMRK